MAWEAHLRAPTNQTGSSLPSKMTAAWPGGSQDCPPSPLCACAPEAAGCSHPATRPWGQAGLLPAPWEPVPSRLPQAGVEPEVRTDPLTLWLLSSRGSVFCHHLIWTDKGHWSEPPFVRSLGPLWSHSLRDSPRTPASSQVHLRPGSLPPPELPRTSLHCTEPHSSPPPMLPPHPGEIPAPLLSQTCHSG